MSLKLIEDAIEKIATASTDEGLRDVLWAQNKDERKKAWGRLGQKSKHNVGATAVAGGVAGGVVGGLAGHHYKKVGAGKGALAGAALGAGLNAAGSSIRNKFIDYAREKGKGK